MILPLLTPLKVEFLSTGAQNIKLNFFHFQDPQFFFVPSLKWLYLSQFFTYRALPQLKIFLSPLAIQPTCVQDIKSPFLRKYDLVFAGHSKTWIFQTFQLWSWISRNFASKSIFFHKITFVPHQKLILLAFYRSKISQKLLI